MNERDPAKPRPPWSDRSDRPWVRELVEDLAKDVATLAGQTAELAAAELGLATRRIVATSGGLLVVAASAAAGLAAVIAAAVLGAFAMGLEPWVACLLVGLVLLALAGLVLAGVLFQLRSLRSAFAETIRSTQENAARLRAQVSK